MLPFIPMFGDGKQPCSRCSSTTSAASLADAALRPEAANTTFELGGPDVMSMNDVVKTALDVPARSARCSISRRPSAKLIGTLSSVLPQPPLTADAIDFITEPAVADNSKLIEVLHPQLTPLREGLATYLG